MRGVGVRLPSSVTHCSQVSNRLGLPPKKSGMSEGATSDAGGAPTTPTPVPAPAEPAVNKTPGDASTHQPVEGSTSPRINLREQFKTFSKFGDTKSDGKHITLSQSDKWMKQAKVIDGKAITTTDTAIHFKKFKSLKITLEDYKKFVEDLAKTKKVEVSEIEQKLAGCGAPGLHGVSASTKIDSTVERLTDVSKYTGSHKLRFDEAGKGKGAAGRKDEPDKSGYVSGYQNKDTYSKTH